MIRILWMSVSAEVELMSYMSVKIFPHTLYVSMILSVCVKFVWNAQVKNEVNEIHKSNK